MDLLLRALSERGDSIDLLTFHEGRNQKYERLQIFRIKPPLRISSVRPGPSWKKLICDAYLFFRFLSLMRRNEYDIVHAVEETAFMAMLVCPFFSTPYVYDMDSSMTTQIVDKYPILRPFERFLRFFESLPIRHAQAVVPMCDALAQDALRYRPRDVVVLHDVSLVSEIPDSEPVLSPRDELGFSGKIAMYIGNLESYQGIDLLLESFALVQAASSDVALVIIGGDQSDIEKYRTVSVSLGIAEQVYFLGKRPVSQIAQHMAHADILVSPRTRGVNTPMKIYSYLDSGKPVLATDLPTHRQVMSNDIAMLAQPDRESFAMGMLKLLEDTRLRTRLAQNAKAYIQREHSYPAFKEKLYDLYARLDRQLVHDRAT